VKGRIWDLPLNKIRRGKMDGNMGFQIVETKIKKFRMKGTCRLSEIF
jgi:hypothetical protein